MKSSIILDIPEAQNITLELDDAKSPETVRAILANLPIKTKLNIWGEEIYTDPIPAKVDEEKAVSVVSLLDVAYWPPGQALCLFYGPTPMSSDQIKPYSPVNIIGKIQNPDKQILEKLWNGIRATVRAA